MKSYAWLIVLTLFLAFNPASAEDLDPRLSEFLESEIQDKAVLEQTKETFRIGGMKLETFILLTFTGSIRADESPDNSLMLAKLGRYIERRRPELYPGLLPPMREFYENPDNRTFMRGMFMQTITANIIGE